MLPRPLHPRLGAPDRSSLPNERAYGRVEERELLRDGDRERIDSYGALVRALRAGARREGDGPGSERPRCASDGAGLARRRGRSRLRRARACTRSPTSSSRGRERRRRATTRSRCPRGGGRGRKASRSTRRRTGARRSERRARERGEPARREARSRATRVRSGAPWRGEYPSCGAAASVWDTDPGRGSVRTGLRSARGSHAGISTFPRRRVRISEVRKMLSTIEQRLPRGLS